METNIGTNLKELKRLYEYGCIFFEFVTQPIGICMQVNDANTNCLLYMHYLTYEQAQEIVKADLQSPHGVIIIRPESELYRLFMENINNED